MATNSNGIRIAQPTPPPPPPPPRTPSNHETPTLQNGEGESLTAAADLIKTLDTAFAEMSSLSASAAKDAEDARRNARAASEVARRYTVRSFPQLSTLSSSPTKKSTPMTDLSQKVPSMMNNSNSSDGNNNRKRRIPKPPASAELLAESHAEDVLSLSMELERTKQLLEQEQMEHDQTRMSLTKYRAKNTQLESQMDKLLADFEKQKEDHGYSVDDLKRDLRSAVTRANVAEEDAQVALDLAKQAAESREQLEGYLQEAVDEVTLLRNQLEQVGVPPGSVMPTASSPSDNTPRGVRFAESPTVLTVPNRDGTMVLATPPSAASRSMVAAGRKLLTRAIAASPDTKMHAITLTPQKSAERRQRLRDRLKSLDQDVVISSPSPIVSKSPSRGVDLGAKDHAVDSCLTVANTLRESAHRLGLTGRWGQPNSKITDASQVESMTRHYCSSVESKLKSQTSELKGLSSLCSYMEEKLALSNGSTDET